MKIFFTGDLYFNPQKKNKTVEISEEVKRVIYESDFLCVNLEGPIVDAAGNKYKNKKGPVIMQDKERIGCFHDILKNVQIIYTLANNHIMDYGKVGLESTFEFLKDKALLTGAGLSYEQAYQCLELESDDGIKVGLLNVAEGGFGALKNKGNSGYAYFLERGIRERIEVISKKCDKTVIVVHAGLEEQKIPLLELRDLYRGYIDSGADIVIAHHPHIIQGFEKYKHGEIYYSLGNFMFDDVSEKGKYLGFSIGVLIDFDKGKLETQVIPLNYLSGVCAIDKRSMDYFEDASQLIQDDKTYEKLLTKICLNCYKDYYMDYYKNVCMTNSVAKHICGLISHIFGKEYVDESMLYHNLAIETHYWAVRRALEKKICMYGDRNE